MKKTKPAAIRPPNASAVAPNTAPLPFSTPVSPKPPRGRTKLRRAPRPFAMHLHSEFPAEELHITHDDLPEWSKPKFARDVADYFAAYGAPVAATEIPEAQIGAWAYLEREPGHWVTYLYQAPWLYGLARHLLTASEQSYIWAIATDDRTTATKFFGETRWASGLQHQLSFQRRNAGQPG